jgi:hypothetical protein
MKDASGHAERCEYAPCQLGHEEIQEEVAREINIERNIEDENIRQERCQ